MYCVCNCDCVDWWRDSAVGKSKKLAKRNAALAMLNAVRLGGVEPNIQVIEQDEYEDEDPIALVRLFLI